jgi:5-methylcytosine-specific restriction endonuclease McrA
MAEHSLTCRTCAVQFTYHRRKAYCTPSCRPGFYVPINPVAVTCRKCGGPMPEGSSRNKKYCSHECGRAGERERAAARRPEVECAVCNTMFRPKGLDRVTCCSRECGFVWSGFLKTVRSGKHRVSYSVYRINCADCGTKAQVRKGATRCKSCSDNRQSVYISIKGTTRQCGWCSTSFTVLSDEDFRSTKFCSKACSRKNMRSKPAYREMQKQAKARRRARKSGATHIQSIKPIDVFERDRWRCGICGCKTHKAKRGTYHPRAPELDHIVALANGGSHTWGNLQCSCRECNGRKGATDYGQLHMMFDTAVASKG